MKVYRGINPNCSEAVVAIKKPEYLSGNQVEAAKALLYDLEEWYKKASEDSIFLVGHHGGNYIHIIDLDNKKWVYWFFCQSSVRADFADILREYNTPWLMWDQLGQYLEANWDDFVELIINNPDVI